MVTRNIKTYKRPCNRCTRKCPGRCRSGKIGKNGRMCNRCTRLCSGRCQKRTRVRTRTRGGGGLQPKSDDDFDFVSVANSSPTKPFRKGGLSFGEFENAVKKRRTLRQRKRDARATIKQPGGRATTGKQKKRLQWSDSPIDMSPNDLFE